MSRFFRAPIMVREQAGDNGGGGSGSLLTSANAGSGSQAAQAGTNSANAPDQGSGQASAGGNGGGSQGNASQTWRSSLPAELQNDPAIQTFNDVAALTKSFINAQKLVGSDKIPVPSKHATDEDWMGVFQKLGLPKEVKDYELKFKDGSSIDEEFTGQFKEQALKAGILPKQAQKIADWFSELNSSAEVQIKQQRDHKMAEELKGLQQEWGVAYDKNLKAAARVVQEIGDPELVKYLDQTGLGNDVRLIKLFANLSSKYMKEDSAVGGNNGLPPAMTPKDAINAANKIMADFSHPYHIKDHPNHAAAVAEVHGYFQMANPGPAKKSS